jgi:hypothetical protein
MGFNLLSSFLLVGTADATPLLAVTVTRVTFRVLKFNLSPFHLLPPPSRINFLNQQQQAARISTSKLPCF